MFFEVEAKPVKNEIVEIVYNRDFGQGVTHMELGCVKFYFSGNPIFNYVPERKKKKNRDKKASFATKVFVFPYANIKDMRVANFINDDTKNKEFRLTIEKIKAPVQGVKLTVVYNPEKIELDYACCNSTSTVKAVVFNFYNKKLKDKLQIREERILGLV